MVLDLDFLKTVVPAIITGGGSAIGSSLAFLKDLRSRIAKLESRVGSKDEGTGLSQEVVTLRSRLDEQSSKIDSVLAKKDPPSNFRPPSYPDEFVPFDIAPRSSSSNLANRLDELEEEVKRLKQRQAYLVQEEDFDASDRTRGKQIEDIRSSIDSLRGLLEGLREGLGVKRR